MDGDHPSARLGGRVRDELRQRSAVPDRLSSVVTDSVPSTAPGEMLLCFARADPDERGAAERGADGAMEAAVAVEFAALHQYLHAIPVASAPLADPARDSPYADDEVAAIIDGDWLQAAAFARVAGSTSSAGAARRCHAALSGGSTRCYELWERSNEAADPAPIAPLIGAAGRIGAIVAGLDRSAGATVADVARSIGAAVPIRTPAGTGAGTATTPPSRSSLVEDLSGVVGDPERVVDELERLASGDSALEVVDS
ncbi:hypothetical protein [Salinarchaeum laminariae]|uniref:hypothetical protein n=1 Tax=Salinarchaeum laminariae TaxID=869888 RepID=UPI0020C01A46|nr:hypothetical protein [Salinarchaeum laminariae]